MNTAKKLVEEYKLIRNKINNITDHEIYSPAQIGFPQKEGVYICCDVTPPDEVKVVYIGSSSNIAKRLNQNNHSVYKKHDGHLNFLFIPCEQYNELEIKLIKSLSPKYNMQHNYE